MCHLYVKYFRIWYFTFIWSLVFRLTQWYIHYHIYRWVAASHCNMTSPSIYIRYYIYTWVASHCNMTSLSTYWHNTFSEVCVVSDGLSARREWRPHWDARHYPRTSLLILRRTWPLGGGALPRRSFNRERQQPGMGAGLKDFSDSEGRLARGRREEDAHRAER